jgi:hypothetical protein
MWIKIKKWLVGNTASGLYAYTLTKIGDAIWTPKNLGIMNAVGWYILGVVLFFIFAFLFKKLFHTNNVPKLKLVENKKFMKQTIRLDGYHYRDCTFDSCTLEYCGGYFEIRSTMDNCQVAFNHRIAIKASQLVYALHQGVKKPEDIEMLDTYTSIKPI